MRQVPSLSAAQGMLGNSSIHENSVGEQCVLQVVQVTENTERVSSSSHRLPPATQVLQLLPSLFASALCYSIVQGGAPGQRLAKGLFQGALTLPLPGHSRLASASAAHAGDPDAWVSTLERRI